MSDVDVYGWLGVEPIINAGGTLTRLSGSIMYPEVADAMHAASRHFVDMGELHAAAGRRIAELIGVEGAHVCAGATAGIAVMAAAVMAGSDPDRVRRLPDTTGLADRFVALKVHRNPFDQALRLAGARFLDVDPNPDAIRAALHEEGVAGFFYTFSWFNTGDALDLPAVIDLAREAGKPVIVDAAAEVPPLAHLRLFVEQGADLVTFSGGKAMRGPQASGIILSSRADLIDACAANDSPNMSVGRGMKTGKEEICGVVKAIELYLNRDHEADAAVWEGRVARILAALENLGEGVRAWRQLPHGKGQQIPHVAITWSPADLEGRSCQDVAVALKAGTPRIACQLIHEPIYAFAKETGVELRFHVHTLKDGEEETVARCLREALKGGP
jgi:L-seryl-tRNA(Ser) seleniumtransferase